MPTAIYRVTHVYASRTKKAGVIRHEFALASLTPGVPSTIVDTVNEWKASLCQRAHATQRPIQIGWRDTVWGHEIITVDLPREQQAEAR